MKKLFVGNLAPSAKEQEITSLFSEYGRVRSIRLVMDVFTDQCKGFGFVEMEGHEARAAIAGLNGKDYLGKPLRVNFETTKGRGNRR